MKSVRALLILLIVGSLVSVVGHRLPVMAAGSSEGPGANQLLSRVMVDLKSGDAYWQLVSSGLDITDKVDGYLLDVLATPEDLKLIGELGYSYEVLVEDMIGRHLSMLDDPTLGNIPTGYHTYAEMVAEMNQIILDHPSITTLTVIGTSLEGRDIHALKISDNASVDETEPELYFSGVHHARELPSGALIIDLMNYLTDNYGTDPDVTTWVNEREIWLTPVVNPDGYVYVDTTYIYHRKNRRDLSGCSGTDDGIDLNRNYGYLWGLDDTGSSPYECDTTYRGPSPFSEPEVQAVRDFVATREFVFAENTHTHGYLILWPWGNSTVQAPDAALLEAHGNAMGALAPNYDPIQSVYLYPTNGDANDWMYGDILDFKDYRVLSYTYEMGDASDYHNPPWSRCLELIAEARPMLLYLIEAAADPLDVLPPNPPILDAMGTDDDGDYTVSWNPDLSGDRESPVVYELQEMTGFTRITDDLESGASDWTLDLFSITSARFHSSNKAFYSGSSDNRNSTAAVSTPITVQSGDDFTFWTWYRIETDWDYAYVEISTDGSIWTSLPGSITTTSNPNGNNAGNGITGNSSGWIQATFDLESYVGQQVQLRFRYDTDGYVLEEGFYADDIFPVEGFTNIVTLSSTIPGTSYAVTGNVPDTYYYRVRGKDDDNQWSPWSSVESMEVEGPPSLRQRAWFRPDFRTGQ